MTPRGRAVWVGLALALASCGRGAPPAPPAASAAPSPDVTAEPVEAAPDVAAAPVEAAPVEAAPDAAPAAAADVPKAEILGWVVLEPEDGGFRIELPVDPEYVTSTVTAPSGLVTKLRQWNATDPVSGAMLVVALAPLVQQLVQHGSSERALEGTIRSLQKPGLHLDAIRVIELDGFPGREADVTISAPGEGEAHGKVRIYLVGYRIYQILGVWLDEGTRTEVEKALGSFRLAEDAADLEKHPVDLWQRADAPFGALEVELPGKPERATTTRTTAFGVVEVESLSLVSSFPPAAYGLSAFALPDADAELPAGKVLDRWAAALDPKPTKVARATALGGVARRALTADGARLAFVHDGRLYELVWQALEQGHDPVRKGTDAERDRWFGSPRVKGAAP